MSTLISCEECGITNQVDRAQDVTDDEVYGNLVPCCSVTICGFCSHRMLGKNEDTELLDWYTQNPGCVFQLGGKWYALPFYNAPIRAASDFRAAIRLARKLRTEWLEKSAKANKVQL